MTLNELIRKAKKASKKELVWGIGCFVGCIGLAVWFVVSVLMA